ncbi:HlyD family secretion protein [Inquilinus limosus]|uniref:Multidrug resistance protein MdtA-like barrel-sandwich hybrid domain-containing protein n=1 Tax=Inquilinus limosus MP06 TaxID=1398085 RepID=A0A0A0DG17_9PROT|nr:HlyD family secretion protein [Inquilinus limosus]KGM35892.1 hypothetical protein P409_01850 [Inquilinus limosus MP06]
MSIITRRAPTEAQDDPAASTAPGRGRTRRGKALLLAAAAVAVSASGCAAGWHWWTVGRFLQETDDAYVRADVVTISPRVSGYVAAVMVGDNEPVQVGEVLLRIDDRDHRAERDKAQAAVDAADADVAADLAAIATIDAQLQQQRSAVAEARAAADGADAEAQRARRDFDRFLALADRQAASRQRLETAEADSRKADAALAKARAALEAEAGRVPVLTARRREAEAALERSRAQAGQARATLALAQNALDSTVIRAPTGGMVGQRTVRAGQYVEPGLPLLAVVPLDSAYVVANFKETQLRAMAPGQPANISVDAFGGTVLHGHVGSFSPASGAQFALLPPDNATGNFTKIVQRIPVKILIDRPAERSFGLRAGMSVVATVDTRAGDRPEHSDAE